MLIQILIPHISENFVCPWESTYRTTKAWKEGYLCCKAHVVPAKVADLEEDVPPLELGKIKLSPALLLLLHTGQLAL